MVGLFTLENIMTVVAYIILCNIPCCRGNGGYVDIEALLAKRPKATKIPQHEIECLARCFLPAIEAFFESDEGKREFEEWKAEQEKLTEDKKDRKKKVG